MELTVQLSAVSALLNSTPLLEEERHPRGAALITKGDDPIALHRPSTRTALSADNHPIDTAEVNAAEILKQRLD